jgi:signal transduction histidine kinase
MSTRRRLSHLLLATHIGLVLLFAALLVATGFGTIRSAVVAQARAEAERAVSESRRRLQEWQRELDVGADLLAEQPTLRFYLQRGQSTKARGLVEDFHGTSAIEYIHVQLRGETVAEVGLAPPRQESGLAFDQQGGAWRIVRRGIESLPGAVIVVAERLGGRLSQDSENRLVSVRLQPLMTASAPADPWAQALMQVSQSGEPDTFEDVGGSAAARVVVLRDRSGNPSALLSARVDRQWVSRRIIEWFAAFGASSIVTALLALALAILVSARIGRPFAELAKDSERLGAGDFETPVSPPHTFLAEPAALADSLEKMRSRVSLLTTTERNQREELDAVLDGVDEGIVGVDGEQRIHYANRQFLALVGKDRDFVLGKNIQDLIMPREHGPTVLPLVGERLEQFAVIGSMRPLLVRRQLASGARQVLVVREENAIEAARAMRDRILANLSHEFQTPLSAQMAAIELLRDHLQGSSDLVAIQLTDAQYRGTLRLSQLVDNLLDSVRIESGEMRLRREPVDLRTLVGEAIELIRPLIDQREQRVLAEVAAMPVVVGDSQRLLSVIVNLLANANKFAPNGTLISLQGEWDEDFATMWVEDEGPGLPALHEAGDVFAPFRRSPHEEPSQRGTGLGLAIVKAIVVAHGGDVLVAPPVRGHGARIGIRLPRRETQ